MSLFLSFKLRLTLQLYFENDLLLLFSILQVQLTYFKGSPSSQKFYVMNSPVERALYIKEQTSIC